MSDEVSKLQNHLGLLREEYVKLQTKYRELEKKYELSQAASGQLTEDSFVARLLRIVAELFDKETYSDLVVRLKGQDLKAHRFVLAARSDHWGVDSLANVTSLDFTDIPYDVGHTLIKWVYTDDLDIKAEEGFLLSLLRIASRFKLTALCDRCEKALTSSVNVRNCIQFYQTAEEIGAETLKKHCSELISSHWNEFGSEDFATMPPQLAYQMFKTKSEFPLHTAIRIKREDVVFLYLIEFSAQLPAKLNEVDSQGDLALDLALKDRSEGIATSLVQHGVDVDRQDKQGRSLLHLAIKRGDEYAARFLIHNKANVNAVTITDKETALLMVASFNPEVTSVAMMEGMANIATLLLEHGANVNAQDAEGSTSLHRAIWSKNNQVFSILLKYGGLDLELTNKQGDTPLWLALQNPDQGQVYSDNSFATRLVKHGSSLNAVNPKTGDSVLHKAARSSMEDAAIYLCKNGATVNVVNGKGESPLHIACTHCLGELVRVLLSTGANPNVQSTQALTPTEDEDEALLTAQTPLHTAICNGHREIVQIFLHHKAAVTSGGDNMMIIPNFSIKDSQGHTVLGLALWQGFLEIATELLVGGADINDYDTEGHTLLHQAIIKQDTTSALFLLEHHADPNAKTKDGQTCLQLAIERHLAAVVDNLCTRGASMNVMYSNGDCPLWHALDTGQEDVASSLVQHGCDTNMWGPGPDDCQQTLLHRAIDENNEPVGCFLIRSGCDINSPRRPGPNGEGGEEARDLQTPLHLAASWGLESAVQALVEHNANVNSQDIEGKSPIHVAIINQHPVIISLLLSHPTLDLAVQDRQGYTPFAAAMMTKNNKAAQAILDRAPSAAEQVDNRGRNFLHVAIQKGDIESVLFLISVHADVNSRVQDSSQLSPLHLAVLAGSEMIVRNLLLAGAHINVLAPQKQTPLHLAAAHDHANICSVLLENGVDYDAVDDGLNNALHISVQHGHLASCRVLLTESSINAEAINLKGQNPLHVLSHYGKENAAAIFELFRECMPDYPINKPDANGNTALLLAYTNGNGNLCRAIVRAGASLGIVNRDDLSIFSAPVATKQLLFKLLDMLSSEPPWADSETCLECNVKFGIKTRKHHCRHCGRVLCSKCSDKDIPIIKFNISKPVRVCQLCFDVLTLGTAGAS